MRYGLTLIAVLVFLLSGCIGESDETIPTTAYVCSFPCLKSAPTLSSDVVLSATGGTVVLDIELDGDLTNISSVFVHLSKIGGGSSAGLGTLFIPTHASNSIPITVDAGVATGDYYPQIVFKYVTPEYAGSQYYLNPSLSSSEYIYYEWEDNKATRAMRSTFEIPKLVIQ